MAYTPQFNPQPIGAVTVVTPGTPVQLTATLQTVNRPTGQSGKIVDSASDSVPTNKIFLSANPLAHSGAGNTGKVYIGQQTMDKTTLVGVVAVIPAGGTWSITHPVGLNVYQFDKWYVDADNASDSVYGEIDTI